MWDNGKRRLRVIRSARWFVLLALASSSFAPVALGRSPDSDAQDEIVQLRKGDPEMAAAIQKARRGLAEFLALAESPRPGLQGFSLKDGIPVGDDVEYVWVEPFRRNGDDFEGRLANTVQLRPDLQFGQAIVFDESNIADWSYRDGSRLVGNETSCVLVRRRPRGEWAALEAKHGLNCNL